MNRGFCTWLCGRSAPLDKSRQSPWSACRLWPITLVALALSADIHAQGKPDAGPAIPARVEGAAKPTVDPPNTIRFDESLQHGFFGDLSRPAPPALNHIYGIRVPETTPPAPEEPSAPSGKPAQAVETGKAKSPEQPTQLQQAEGERREAGKPEPAKSVPEATRNAPAAAN